MKKKSFKSLIKKILLSASAIYVIYILMQQQIMLNAYETQGKYYLQRINEEEEKTAKLERQKLLYSTDMYIEKIAREKLGFVKYNEKVFVDITKR
ncbi:MAG: septum formation initiator family protein [Clostridia bacterium]